MQSNIRAIFFSSLYAAIIIETSISITNPLSKRKNMEQFYEDLFEYNHDKTILSQ